jgi:hypothetical protein
VLVGDIKAGADVMGDMLFGIKDRADRPLNERAAAGAGEILRGLGREVCRRKGIFTTAGLDPLMQRKFFDLIKKENSRGVTVFFSSHILGEVQRLCNRVGIIREGKIAEISDIRTLQKNNYKKVRVIAEGLDPAAFNLRITSAQVTDRS